MAYSADQYATGEAQYRTGKSVTNDETWKGAAAGAGQGAAMGAVGGPMGMAIGAGAGAIIGGVSGTMQGRARKRQKRERKRLELEQRNAVKAEQRRRDANVGTVRDTFGVLPTAGEKNRNLGKTLTNRSEISGAIEQNADNASNAVTAENVAESSSVNQDVTASLAQRGMLGSSIDDNARQTVLVGYGLGKSNAVGAANQERTRGWDSVTQARRPLERLAANGQDISGNLNAMKAASDFKQAQIGLNYSQYTDLIASALNGFGAMSKTGMKQGASDGSQPPATSAGAGTTGPSASGYLPGAAPPSYVTM